EAVPAEAHFVHLRRREHADQGEGDELYARRRNGIKSWQWAAGGVEGQRELLGTVAEEVAAAHVILAVEAVIDFRDDTAEVIERRSARDIIRSKVVISIEAASVVGGDSGNIVLRVVRIDIDKSLPDRADLAAPCDDRRLGSRDLRERRDAVHRHDSHVFALAFVVEEEESL